MNTRAPGFNPDDDPWDAWGDEPSTYTAAVADAMPSLTAEHIAAVVEQLQAKLPAVHYIDSKYTPEVDADGDPAMWWIVDRQHLQASGAPDSVSMLAIIHPNNLPMLQRLSRGQFRLLRYIDEVSS